MKRTIRLLGPLQRKTAWQAIADAPDGTIIEFKDDTRSNRQNSLMWATLGDIARDVVWHGRKLTPIEWKSVFSAALAKQDVVPGLDGSFVVLGQSTSRMSVREMIDLVDLMTAFGNERGVRWAAQELAESDAKSACNVQR